MFSARTNIIGIWAPTNKIKLTRESVVFPRIPNDNPLIQSILEHVQLNSDNCIFLDTNEPNNTKNQNIFSLVPYIFADANGEIFENLLTNDIENIMIGPFKDQNVCILFLSEKNMTEQTLKE